jgi:hypothetical protein
MYPPTYILLVAVMAVVHVDGSPLIKYDKTLTIKATTVETLPPLPPLCSWDPEIGQYICPGPSTTTQIAPKPTSPICTWDPSIGQYVCPE